MKFEVKNNQFHIDGEPTDSAMEIGIAIQKELKQGEAVLNHYRTDVNKLARMVEMQSQYDVALYFFNRLKKESNESLCTLSNPDYLPQLEFGLFETFLRLANDYLFPSSSGKWVTIETVNDLPNPKDHAAVFVQWNNKVLLMEIKNSTPKAMLEEFAQKGFRKWHPLIYPKQ